MNLKWAVRGTASLRMSSGTFLITRAPSKQECECVCVTGHWDLDVVGGDVWEGLQEEDRGFQKASLRYLRYLSQSGPTPGRRHHCFLEP